MDIIEAIRSRRSVGRVKPDPVEKEKIETMLESATWAPNHFYTEPWRFFVLTGEGRRALGRTLAEIAKEGMDDPNSEENQRKLKKTEEKPFRAPVVIAVAVQPSDDEKVIRLEEIGAVNAAVQNMLLTAHALGLGAIWRTGKPTYHPKMKEFFGLGDNDEVVGFIYVGYPDLEGLKGRRTAFDEKTKWIDQDQN